MGAPSTQATRTRTRSLVARVSTANRGNWVEIPTQLRALTRPPNAFDYHKTTTGDFIVKIRQAIRGRLLQVALEPQNR
jgi:hypothetical protein